MFSARLPPLEPIGARNHKHQNSQKNHEKMNFVPGSHKSPRERFAVIPTRSCLRLTKNQLEVELTGIATDEELMLEGKPLEGLSGLNP